MQEAELNRYITQVRRIPVLTREAESELAHRVVAGDRRAADELARANLRYVVAVALKYRRYGLPLGDLIAEGSVGLMTAVKKFDPTRGTRFVTYAGYWIRALILEFVVRSASLVGGGTGALRSKLYFRLRRERARLEMLERDPVARLAKLARDFDTTPERMERMLARVENKDVSLDTPASNDGTTTYLDLLASDAEGASTEHDAAATLAAQQEAVQAALAALDPRERFIIEQRVMQFDEEEMTLAALGRELGVSRERARQLEARAKEKLRAELSSVWAA